MLPTNGAQRRGQGAVCRIAAVRLVRRRMARRPTELGWADGLLANVSTDVRQRPCLHGARCVPNPKPSREVPDLGCRAVAGNAQVALGSCPPADALDH